MLEFRGTAAPCHQLRQYFKSHAGEITEGVSLGRTEMGARAEPAGARRRCRLCAHGRAAEAAKEGGPAPSPARRGEPDTAS